MKGRIEAGFYELCLSPFECLFVLVSLGYIYFSAHGFLNFRNFLMYENLSVFMPFRMIFQGLKNEIFENWCLNRGFPIFEKIFFFSKFRSFKM